MCTIPCYAATTQKVEMNGPCTKHKYVQQGNWEYSQGVIGTKYLSVVYKRHRSLLCPTTNQAYGQLTQLGSHLSIVVYIVLDYRGLHSGPINTGQNKRW